MDGRTRKGIVAGAAVAAIAISGSAAVVAGSADDDRPLTGSALEKATDAALAHTGGGEITGTEMDEGGYEVEVRLPDGTQVEVNLDTDFKVTGQEADDDADRD